jgi:hypothetical protein
MDLVDRTMQLSAFMSGTFAGAMHRCNIAIRRFTQFGAPSRGGVPCYIVESNNVIGIVSAASMDMCFFFCMESPSFFFGCLP